MAGQQPNEDRSACVDCVGLTYSPMGVECLPCEGDNVVNPGRSTCQACLAGQGPVGSDNGPVRTSCSGCNGTTYSTVGVCRDCPAPMVVDSDNMRCYGCATGRAPNAERNDCIACVGLEGLKFSSLGTSCDQCEGNNVVNDARTSCLPCSGGYGPNANRTGCVPCDDQHYHDILGFSQVGVCNDCPVPSVVNDDRTVCMPCAAGFGPNEDRDGCVGCIGVFYSPFGVCQECLPPAIPIMGNTFCSETVCRPGTMCPDGETCNVEADCIECEPGTVGLGGDCTACHLDGSVANQLQSACEQCFAGKQPNTNRSGCDDCSFNEYSTFGYVCDDCGLPAVVNDIRTVCSTCPAGLGTFNGADDHDWECEACFGTTYSPAGTCLDCELPYVASTDHRQCSPVSAQQFYILCLSLRFDGADCLFSLPFIH